jgi:hypothetical protein
MQIFQNFIGKVATKTFFFKMVLVTALIKELAKNLQSEYEILLVSQNL